MPIDKDEFEKAKELEQTAEDTIECITSNLLEELLNIPEVLDAVLDSIPEGWQYRESEAVSNPTKKDFAFYYLWELEAIKRRYSDARELIKTELMKRDQKLSTTEKYSIPIDYSSDSK